MQKHDIIDNRNEKLVDHINRILETTERAHFAVGYFFLSGFSAIKDKLRDLKELRLVIGNVTNRKTLEQLTEGYKRLEMVEEAVRRMRFIGPTDVKNIEGKTAENLRESIALTEQTDENEEVIVTLARLIEEKRLKVRVYTKGRLHAKAYIFDYGTVYDKSGKPLGREEKGIAIVGSSNLTLAGVTDNTELNVLVQGNENHEALMRWFEELWGESQDFNGELMHELKESWAMACVRPYDIYMKTLYHLVKDRIEGTERGDILWDDEIVRKLTDFQKVAVRQLIQMIKDYNGAFAADVVGVGKSFVGAAVLKYFGRAHGLRGLVICPKSLESMWERYNEEYHLNAKVLPMSLLRESDRTDELLNLYRERDFVLIDESHNFRYHTTQRYEKLEAFLRGGKKCCFLTATPRNKTAWDVYHQIKLFHPDDKTDLPIDPPDLNRYFKMIEKGERRLQDLLPSILVRRTRNHIIRWYGYDANTNEKVDPSRYKPYVDGRKRAYILVGGEKKFFPKRELETIEYSIEAVYQGLYQQIRSYLGRPREKSHKTDEKELTYARYGLWNYVKKEKQKEKPYSQLNTAGANLRGLIRVMLFKRFESSVYAFRETIKRLIKIHKLFAESLQKGIVPAGDEAQALLYESDNLEEKDLFDALSNASSKYKIEDFEAERLKQDISKDLDLLREIYSLVCEERIPPEQDAKLGTLKRWLQEEPLIKGKKLIFTQFADTAKYLYENLNPNGSRGDIEVIYGDERRSIDRIVGRFAPKSNPEYKFKKGETEIETLIATDVLAEGLNLQDCDKVVNYDLHWNPVRLIQRFGRIDRIGTEYDVVWGFNFLPETELEKNLGLREKLRNRIQEIHDTIGEDAAVLDKSEQLNEEAMYAIYEKKGGQLPLFDEEEESIDIGEAEEILRQLRHDDIAEYERIANLRDGIRTAMPSSEKGTYVFCEAGAYKKLFLVDSNGQTVTTDTSTILGKIKCSETLKGLPVPKDHNKVVMRVKRLFDEEVKHIRAERRQKSLGKAQRYVLKELRLAFDATEDKDFKARINLLEEVFLRSSLPDAVIRKELNPIRRNGLSGEQLIKELQEIYYQYNLKRILDRKEPEEEEEAVPKIVCSESLV
ncbi:MAG: phospholipase D-like domain-containing protein [Planctomycetota bacterium]|nr:phospholipase D-like domain-containing protein [Planctomycetota bacterium]